MKPKALLIQLIFVGGLLGVAAWSWSSAGAPVQTPEPSTEDEAQSAEGDWELVQIAGEAPRPETRVTLLIQDGTLGGFSGCNQYGGTFAFEPDGTFRVGEIAATAMLCIEPTGVMEQEAFFFTRLSRTARLEITPGTLSLLDEAGSPVLVFQAVQRSVSDPEGLERSAWEWRGIDQEPVEQTGLPVQLRFASGDLSGFAGCRHFIGTYLVEEDAIRITSLEMMPEDCGNAAGRQLEDRFLTTTDLFERFRFVDGELEIKLQTGPVLFFSAIESSEPFDTGLAEYMVRDFFDALSGGDYDHAASLFAPSADFLETLYSFNPDMLQASLSDLLEAACTRQFFCMPVHEILETRSLSEQAAQVRVIFMDRNGEPFRLGACCGGDEPPGDSPTTYTYLVRWTSDGYRVSGGLVYVP